MDNPATFLDWLLRQCRERGSKHLFGVPGGGTSLDVIAAAKQQGMAVTITAREDAAVIMAGVSGILADAPGLAFMTKGPGLASAANGIAAAALDRMPVLAIAETFGPGELAYVSHQVFDQDAVAHPLLENGGYGVIPATQTAVENWLSPTDGNGKAAVMFPTSEDFRRSVDPSAPLSMPQETTPTVDAKLIEVALEKISLSRKPVLIIGLEAAQSSLAPAISDLLEHLNCAALTTYMASGVIPFDHPKFAGTFTGGAIEQACVNEADLIILLGLDPVELIRKPWSYDAPVIDLCEISRSPHYLIPELRVAAPLNQTLPALNAALDGIKTSAGWALADIAAHRQQFSSGLVVRTEADLSPSLVVEVVAKSFSGHPRLCVDAGAHMFSACAFWPAKQARDILISNGLASMGFAIPAGIAAALHEPERGAIAMTGDGGALMCLGELKTAAESNANLCIVIFNDGRLSLIDIKREERQMPDLGLSWNRPDFAAVAAGFGLKSWRPTNQKELQTACEEAQRYEGPCLIDAQIDSSGYLNQMKALRG